MNNIEVQIEVNLILDKKDLDCNEEDIPDKVKIINYINRKLRIDSELLGKITEKNVVFIK